MSLSYELVDVELNTALAVIARTFATSDTLPGRFIDLARALEASDPELIRATLTAVRDELDLPEHTITPARRPQGSRRSGDLAQESPC